LRQHVDRVGDHHDAAVEAGQGAADAGHDARVVDQQVQARLAGLAAAPCRYHHHVDLPHLVDAGGAHPAGRVELGAVRQVHRLRPPPRASCSHSSSAAP